MKSIYNSAKNIIEGNYTGKEVPRPKINKIGPDQGSMADRQSGKIEPINPLPDAAGRGARGGTGTLSKIKSAFSRAADLEKSLTANPLPINPPATPKPATNELPSVTTSKVWGTTSTLSPAPVVKPGPTGSENIPADASVPAYIRQNKPEPVLTDKATADKSSADKKAIDLMVKMDQMQQQGIGQTKPKVSSDFYKNLKGIGMKQSNESRMSSAYSVIKRILGEASSSGLEPSEQKELEAYRAAKKSGKPISNKATLRAADLIAKQEKAAKESKAPPQAAMNPPSKDLEAKGLKGNEAMKKQEAEVAAKQAETEKLINREKGETRGDRKISLKPLTPGVGDNRGKVTNVDITKKQVEPKDSLSSKETIVKPTPAPDQSAAETSRLNRSAEQPKATGPGSAVVTPQVEPQKSAKVTAPEVDTVAKTKEMADAEKPVEAPTYKPQAVAEPTKNKADDYTSGDHRRFDPNAPLRGEFSRMNNNPDAKSKTPDAPEEKTQAAVTPSSSEFKFSPEQEKWLGKANRQDPYILARMPGDKPPVEYFKSDDDKKIAKKVGQGISNWNAVKSVVGAEKTKSWGEEKMESVNKKFNVSDALYQSVMEVMKKDKKEGSVPRNDKEKELAAAYGDPKRITHGDVLKMRGVTKEDVDKGGKLEIEDRKKLDMEKKNSPENKEKGMSRGTRKPEPENGMGRIVGGVWQSDPKGKVPMPKGDPEGVKESKDTPGNGYAHQCAIHVKSESYGEGRTITTQHADPDADGNIAWYDVMFEHGIEKQVPTSTLEILVSENHMHMKKKKM